MKKKNLILGLLPCVLLFLVHIPAINASNVRSETFSVYFPGGSALGFQNFPNYVLISVSTGNLNSSVCNTRLYVGGGWFRFTANETVSLTLSFSEGLNVKLSGDNDNELRVISNNTRHFIALNDRINIIWDFAPNIWFPIEFIFGIVGLCSMFGSAILGVHMMNKGEYVDGLKFTVVWFAFGVALTVAWLWA